MKTGFHAFIKSAGRGLGKKRIDLLVMGNEAADLDSMASALGIAYAHFLKAPRRQIIALMPILRRDVQLRPEAVFVFEHAGIDMKDLIFLDDLDPGALKRQVNALALVDHNVLASGFKGLEPRVKYIFDHHENQGRYTGQLEKEVIQPVGSCATIAAQALLEVGQAESAGKPALDPSLCRLLLGAILLDTVNLETRAGRTHPLDEQMVRRLSGACPMDLDRFYRQIVQARQDISGMDSRDLLRKDYKSYDLTWGRVGISSVLISFEDWGQKDGQMASQIQAFARENDLDLLVVMTAFVCDQDRSQGGAERFKRQVAFFSEDLDLYKKALMHLTNPGRSTHGVLELEKMDSSVLPDTDAANNHGTVAFYHQHNAKISRKKLAPLLVNQVETKAQNQS